MINKLWLTLIVVSCFSTAFATEKIVQGDRQLDRNTATLTAKLLIVKLRQAAGQYRVDSENLYLEMQQAPAKHINSVKSRRLLEQAYIKKLKNIYAAQAGQLLNDLQQRVVDKTLFDKSFRSQVTALDNKSLQLNLKNVFPVAYQQARKKIYLEQRQLIVGKIFPNEIEIDTLSSQELQQRLADRIVRFQKFPVYEENFEFIRQSIIEPVIKNAQQQRNMQLKLIQVTDFDDEWLPDSFSAMIRRNLQNWIKVMRKSSKTAKVYGIFPSVEKKIPQVAQIAALDKFSHYLLQVKPEVNEANLIEIMLKSPKAHRTSKQSLALFFKQVKAQTLPKAINQYIATAPADTRQQLQKFLDKNAPVAVSCNNSFAKIFNISCSKIFKQARQNAAAQQFDKIFPELADLSWTPEDKAIQQYYKTNKKTYLSKPLNQPGIATGKIEQQQLLKETLSLVKHAIGYTFANARRAIAGQYAIVETVAENIEKSLKIPDKPGAFSQLLSAVGIGSDTQTTINEEQVYNEFLKQVIEQWTASRIKLVWVPKSPKPVNINSKYQELFPEVKNQIKMLTKAMIKNHLDAIKLKEEQQQELQTVKMKFDIDLIDDEIVILMSSSTAKTNRQFTAPADFSAYRKIEIKFNSNIAKEFETQVKQLAKSGSVKLNVAIRVHNGQIFYQFIADLRDSLQKSTEKMQSSGLDLTLSDRFYKK